MRKEQVEIYSDTSNASVLRHPDRHFPGCSVQGDTLHGLRQSVRRVQRSAHLLDEEAAADLADVADILRAFWLTTKQCSQPMRSNYRSLIRRTADDAIRPGPVVRRLPSGAVHSCDEL